jgi:hypothetical protein
VNTVMNLRVQSNDRKFLSSYTVGCSSRRAQLYEVGLDSLAGWFMCCIKTPLQIGRVFIIEWDHL